MPKITIIGGGSYTWGPTFLRDIFATSELAGSTLILHDIAQDRMDLVYALAQKMIRDFNLNFHLERTLSLEEALQGADFIILTITTGGLESMRADLEIPARYGIQQTVGDTTGPGGLARALRNIPVVAEIGCKVMEICPNALFLNYTNPMTVLTRALAMQGVKVVGLCHEWSGVREKLAQIFNTAPEKITAKVAGVNHLIWMTDLYADGRCVWDELPAVADKILDGEIKVDEEDTSVFADRAKVKATLFKLYDALPAAGDRHIAEFFPHFINESTNWGADYDLRLTRVEDRHEMELEAKGLIEAALRGDVPLAPFMAETSAEAANKIIRAVTCGETYVGIMNLPNAGQIENLPYDAVVETYGAIDVTGAHAITYGEVPAGLQNILQKHIANQEMTVQAALTGDRGLALQVLLNDPLSSRLTIPQAAQLLEEMLEANKHYLPKFFQSQITNRRSKIENLKSKEYHMSELAILGGPKTRTEEYPAWPVWDQRDIDAVTEVVKSGRWGGYPYPGPKTAELAKKFSELQGGGYAVPMTNGTITMEVALRAAGIGWGDEVIVPAYTFQATASAPMGAGAIPVIVDIDPNTYCLDAKAVEKAITPKTKAIIPVHLGHQMADMDAIMELAEKYNLIVIEDCAHAHGAKWRGIGAGTIGHFGSFSLQSSKTLTSGEGGILLCKSAEHAALAASIIDCGRPHALGGGGEDANGLAMQGGNFRLSELQAAMALVGIERFPEQAKQREEMAAYMDESLSEIQGVRVLKRDERHTTRSFYRYIFAINPKEFGVEHDALCSALDAEGIDCWVGYQAMHNYDLFQPQTSKLAVPKAFPEYFDFSKMNLPEATRACEHEAVWLDEAVFRAGPKGVDDAVAAIKKIQRNAAELNKAAEELRKKQGK